MQQVGPPWYYRLKLVEYADSWNSQNIRCQQWRCPSVGNDNIWSETFNAPNFGINLVKKHERGQKWTGIYRSLPKIDASIRLDLSTNWRCFYQRKILPLNVVYSICVCLKNQIGASFLQFPRYGNNSSNVTQTNSARRKVNLHITVPYRAVLRSVSLRTALDHRTILKLWKRKASACTIIRRRNAELFLTFVELEEMQDAWAKLLNCSCQITYEKEDELVKTWKGRY